MGFLQRGLLIYMCLAIAMTFAAPQEVFSGGSPAENTVLSWFNINYDDGTGVVSMGDSTTSSNVDTSGLTDPTSPGSSGSILGFLDPLYQVWSYVKLIFKVLFSPIIILTGPSMTGAPLPIVLILGVPLVFLTILGLIFWIRSGLA
jgi:hypothetical protein